MNYRYMLLFLIVPFFVQAQTLTQRQQAFQSVLNKSKTSELKIKKAEDLARDKRSKFRVDAINYLIDQKSVSSGPIIASLIRDDDVREFAIYGVGELGVYEATPLVIKALKDENHNNRGNAYRALQKMYPQDFNFEFHYDDPPHVRAQIIKNIESWWKTNRNRLKNMSMQEKTDKEKKEAEERWDKYGKEYLERQTP